MATQRTSFAKLQRDRAKKAKAAMKRERRLAARRAAQTQTENPPVQHDEGGELSAAALLEQIELIHKQFDAKEISFEEFEEKKADLLARLPID